MALDRIRMVIQVENVSDQELRLREQKLEHGDWTDPWYPPPSIAPRKVVEFWGEGAALPDPVGPTTGTQGHVRYQIGADPSALLSIHWNSPLIESQYGNTFHIYAPSGWDVSHRGGQGHHARLAVRLRRTERRMVPGFTPGRNGFRFANHWPANLPAMTVGLVWNRLLDSLPDEARDLLQLARADENWLPFTHTSAGLCGGMVFSVMDYWHKGQRPPANLRPPQTEGNPLFQYVRARQWDSFDLAGGGHRFLSYSSPLYPNGDEGFIQSAGLARGRSWVTYRDEWPKIRDDLDVGRLSPVGLVQTDSLDLGQNHQVLAFGYEQSGQAVRLFIYDPNHPRVTTEFAFDITNTTGEVLVQRTTSKDQRIFAMFRLEGYAPQGPVGGRVRLQEPVAAIKTRAEDGHCSLFVTGSDGRVWTNFWPKLGTTDWQGWYPVGENTFPVSG